MEKKRFSGKKKRTGLALFLLANIIFLFGCESGQGSNNQQLSDGEYSNDGYIATVTYVISVPGADQEPVTFTLEAASSGKAVLPPDIEEMDNAIWSGWLTGEGKRFDFDTVLTEDVTLYSTYYPDENNNDVPDGSMEDPVTVYEFRHNSDFTMLTRKFFGQDVAFDYTAEEYAYPETEDDGYIFQGWIEERVTSEDGGLVTVILTPALAPDRNNNDLVDGSGADPYVYHVFLAQDGTVLKEILWLAGEGEVNADDVACPTTTKQKLVGWDRTESVNEAGNTVYTYTPVIIEE